MQRGAGYVIVGRQELERTGNWSLVQRSLDCRAFGVNLVDIPGGESIPEHDEAVANSGRGDKAGRRCD